MNAPATILITETSHPISRGFNHVILTSNLGSATMNFLLPYAIYLSGIRWWRLKLTNWLWACRKGCPLIIIIRRRNWAEIVNQNFFFFYVFHFFLELTRYFKRSSYPPPRSHLRLLQSLYADAASMCESVGTPADYSADFRCKRAGKTETDAKRRCEYAK